MDKGPELWASNQLAVQIFDNVEGSGNQIETSRKTVVYVRTTDVLAAMEINGVDQEDRALMFSKIMLFQSIVNEMRPQHKKK